MGVRMRIEGTLPPAAAPIELREIFNGIAGILDGGSSVARFAEELKAYYGVEHAFLVSSGKAALTVILLALKELAPDKDEVLIPAYTCYSVPAAIVKAGLKVRVCDIDPDTLDFDPDRIEEELRSERLLCVIPTHLFGIPVDVDRLRKLAGERRVAIVEDAAQGMGGEVAGRKVGTLGDIGMFSLGRGKALSTVSGGIIVTSNQTLGSAIGKVVDELPRPRLCEDFKAIMYALALCFLIKPSCYWLPKRLPFLKLGETVFDPAFELKQLGGFQAGIATGWQKKLLRLREVRRRNASVMLDSGLKSATIGSGSSPNMIKLPFLVGDQRIRQRVLTRSDRLGLGIAPVYPEAITGIPEISSALLGRRCPAAESLARSLLTLPVHPFVTRSHQESTLELLRDEGVLPGPLSVARDNINDQLTVAASLE